MIRTMYCATCVQVTARMPPRNEHTRMPPRPRKMPISNGTPHEARGDEADAVDLRHDVGERAQDRAQDADEARDVAAVARAEEVRNRELAELAQVRREEQRHQAVAAGPAHDEREAEIAREVQRAGHADERGRAHPVGAGRHAVEQRRHAPARDVVLRDVGGAADDADAGVQRDGGEQEGVADPYARQAHLLGDREHDDEDDEAAGVEACRLLERRAAGTGAGSGLCGGHYSSPSSTSYSLSSRFMYHA